MIDKKGFEQLFGNVRRNREAIRLQLYELAGIIAATIPHQGLEREDLQHSIWVELDRVVDKYKPIYKNAYGFFYKCGLRESWRVTGKSMAHQHTDLDSVAELTTICLPRDFALPVGRAKDKPNPHKLLDRILRKCRDNIRNLEPTSVEYASLATGIGYLQQFRLALSGSYYPMDLPSVHFSKQSCISKPICA